MVAMTTHRIYSRPLSDGQRVRWLACRACKPSEMDARGEAQAKLAEAPTCLACAAVIDQNARAALQVMIEQADVDEWSRMSDDY